jgi:UPF0176 protein
VGACDRCGEATNQVADCGDVSCVRQMVRCDACSADERMCDRHAVAA